MDEYSTNQAQTKDTFGYKWSKRDTYSRDLITKDLGNWLLEKYFDDNKSKMLEMFSEGKTVLDAGCGASMSAIALIGEQLKKIKYIGVDISTAIHEAEDSFKELGITNYQFIQSDLNNISLSEPVDVIFSEGVLHHTDSTKDAIINLSKHLKKDGYFLFYVYAKKAPIREYTDDYIREYFKDKSNDETWEELYKLTSLGKQLGELDTVLHIEDDIPYLGIKAGDISIQRFFYWYLFKCFYKEGYTLDEMNHINFDWYRPLNCHRQTPEEVKQWGGEAGLEIERLHVEEAGISVIARKL